jgi:hypothetical protein
MLRKDFAFCKAAVVAAAVANVAAAVTGGRALLATRGFLPPVTAAATTK